jgi:hypothetical protein
MAERIKCQCKGKSSGRIAGKKIKRRNKMINFGKIIKRAWHILWNYKVLWIFGVLLAITAGGIGSSGGGSSSYQVNNNGANRITAPNLNGQPGVWLQEFNTWAGMNIDPIFNHPEQHVGTFIWIGVGILLFFLLVGAVMALIRYPTETAVIRMVDELEQTGTKLSFKQGWKLGWSRRAFHMWLIDLIISLPTLLFIGLLVTLGWVVYTSVRNGTTGLAVGGIVAAIGCAFVFILAFIVFMILLTLLRQFFIRQAALEDTSVGEAFRGGWAMFKGNWKSAGLMWLIMLGFRIGVGIAGVIAFFVLIPAYLIMLIPAILVAAIPGLIVFGIASIFTSTTLLAVIIGVLAALPLFFTILFSPVSFISGWYSIFDSNIWTLTYREMKVLQSNVSPALPRPVTK